MARILRSSGMALDPISRDPLALLKAKTTRAASPAAAGIAGAAASAAQPRGDSAAISSSAMLAYEQALAGLGIAMPVATAPVVDPAAATASQTGNAGTNDPSAAAKKALIAARAAISQAELSMFGSDTSSSAQASNPFAPGTAGSGNQLLSGGTTTGGDASDALLATLVSSIRARVSASIAQAQQLEVTRAQKAAGSASSATATSQTTPTAPPAV